MKTDKNGCSTSQPGTEHYENFTHRGKTYYQYDYRHTDGELFSCVKNTLDKCRSERDIWIKKRV